MALGASTALTVASAAIAGPYDAYDGTTLVVNFPAHPHYNAVMKILPEFTKETGIEVEVDQLPYLKMRERQTLELGQDEGDYDLIAYVVFSKADYVYADQLENLARYFMNPKLADPSYDADDLLTAMSTILVLPAATKAIYKAKPDHCLECLTARKPLFLGIARTSLKNMG